LVPIYLNSYINQLREDLDEFRTGTNNRLDKLQESLSAIIAELKTRKRGREGEETEEEASMTSPGKTTRSQTKNPRVTPNV
jgi:Skp family chaperone for outer membrane proteins